MYMNVVEHPLKMLKHPKMLFHFYFVNLIKFAASKFMDRNIYQEYAKKKVVQLAGFLFLMKSSMNG